LESSTYTPEIYAEVIFRSVNCVGVEGEGSFVSVDEVEKAHVESRSEEPVPMVLPPPYSYLISLPHVSPPVWSLLLFQFASCAQKHF
jgi:hypothetical protein